MPAIIREKPTVQGGVAIRVRGASQLTACMQQIIAQVDVKHLNAIRRSAPDAPKSAAAVDEVLLELKAACGEWTP